MASQSFSCTDTVADEPLQPVDMRVNDPADEFERQVNVRRHTRRNGNVVRAHTRDRPNAEKVRGIASGRDNTADGLYMVNAEYVRVTDAFYEMVDDPDPFNVTNTVLEHYIVDHQNLIEFLDSLEIATTRTRDHIKELLVKCRAEISGAEEKLATWYAFMNSMLTKMIPVVTAQVTTLVTARITAQVTALVTAQVTAQFEAQAQAQAQAPVPLIRQDAFNAGPSMNIKKRKRVATEHSTLTIDTNPFGFRFGDPDPVPTPTPFGM